MDPSTLPPSLVSIVELLTYYSLEAEHFPKSASKAKVLGEWLQRYSEQWVKLALVESLYQGRYKMISVDHLLTLWSRRGQATYHFSHEFESLVCQNVPHQMEQAVTFPNAMNVQRLPKPTKTAGVQPPQLPNLTSTTQSTVEQIHSKELDSVETKTVLEPQQDSLEDLQRGSNTVKTPENFIPITDNAEPVELSSVFETYHLGPVMLSRMGLEPIQQFMPEAKSAQFCERLAEIARSQS